MGHLYHGYVTNNQRVSCAAFDTAIEVCSASLVPSDRQDLVTCGRNGDSHVDGGCSMTGWFELGNGQQWLEDSFLFQWGYALNLVGLMVCPSQDDALH